MQPCALSRTHPLLALGANICTLAALLSFADCSGCGGNLASSAGDDASFDARLATDGQPGDVVDGGRADSESGDALAMDSAPDSTIGCLYDDASVDDADVDGDGPCPPAPPAAGSPCGVPDYYCEYGRNWWSRCNLLLSCLSGTWQVFDAGGCPTPEGGPVGGACPGGTCPATWAEATAIDGGPCPAFSCQYPEGDCVCGPGTAGALCSGAPSGWTCLPVAAGCSSPRPRFGTTCSPQDASTGCNMGWNGCCEQSQYCNAEGVWVGYPLGQACMQ